MTKKIIVLGIHPLATKIVRDLQKRSDVEIIAVITTPYEKAFIDPWDEPALYDYALSTNIKIFENASSLAKSFSGKKLDLALNIRFPQILQKNFIDSFSLGVVNTHGGILPMRAGSNIPCFNILLEDAESGCTMHFIDEGIDTGDIIDFSRFPVESHDTAFSLFQKTQKAIWDVYSKNIDNILAGRAKRISQQELIRDGAEKRYFKTSAISAYKEIDPSKMSLKEIDTHVRAFEFPGHEPTYFIAEGRKIYLTSQQYYHEQ